MFKKLILVMTTSLLMTGCGSAEEVIVVADKTAPTIIDCEPYQEMHETTGRLEMLAEVFKGMQELSSFRASNPLVGEIANYFLTTLEVESILAERTRERVSDYIEEEFDIELDY